MCILKKYIYICTCKQVAYSMAQWEGCHVSHPITSQNAGPACERAVGGSWSGLTMMTVIYLVYHSKQASETNQCHSNQSKCHSYGDGTVWLLFFSLRHSYMSNSNEYPDTCLLSNSITSSKYSY